MTPPALSNPGKAASRKAEEKASRAHALTAGTREDSTMAGREALNSSLSASVHASGRLLPRADTRLPVWLVMALLMPTSKFRISKPVAVSRDAAWALRLEESFES